MKKFLYSMAIIGLTWTARADVYNFNGTDVLLEYFSYYDSTVDPGTNPDDVYTPIDSGSWAAADNQAVLVVDFGASSYAFGFAWNTTASGEDLLASTADTGSFEYDFTDFGGGFGIGVDAMRYDGNSMLGFDGYPSNWMGYWLGTDGSDWVASGSGVSGRALTDGSWDGWARETTVGGGDWGYDAITPPLTPVPEPGTMILAGLGLAVIGIRRRRSRKDNTSL